jgi:hypothetical protein
MRAGPFARQALRASSAALAAALGACIPNQFSAVYQARAAMVGLDRNEIRMCAGFPSRTYSENNLDIWSYEKSARSPAGISVPVFPVGASVSVTGGGDCRLQILFREGRVERIAYAGASNAISGRNEFCAPLVNECVRYSYETRPGQAGIPSGAAQPAIPPNPPRPEPPAGATGAAPLGKTAR